ncbi:phage tail tape measure protein [Prauserella coralliicola]|nr:phage tail tape measure protein [Prauserella coralliicola]
MANLSRDLTIDVGWKDDKLDRGTKRSAASMRQLGREIERSQREIDRINRHIAKEEAKFQQERLQRQQQVRQAQEDTGRTLMTVGATTLAATGLAVKAAVDWESAWTGVAKTVEGTPQQMGALQESLRGLARELPSSHQEIAAVAEAAGQLGIKRGAVVDFTRTMINLGETTNLTAEEAATSIAQIANIMGTSQSDVDKFGAALVALGNNGASTEAEILEMSKRLAGAGQLIGASETDVLALANAMASIGISAEAGGGSMSRVMQKIYEAVNEGGDSLEGFARVAGMSAQQFADAFNHDPVGAINTFIQGLNGVEASGGNVIGVLQDLGIRSSEEARTVLGLKGATDLLGESLQMGAQAWSDNRALLEEAEKRYGTTAAQMQIAKNNVVDLAIGVGETLLPVLGDASQKVSSWLQLFRELPAPVQGAIGTLGAAAGAVGLISGAALFMIPKVHEARAALDAMGGAAGRFNKGLGAVGRFLTGPWGVALGGAAFALGLLVDAHAQAAAAQRDFLTALEQDNGALEENVALTALKALQDAEMTDVLRQAGIPLGLVVDAILHQGAALDEVNSRLDAYRERVGGTTPVLDGLRNAFSLGTSDAADQAVKVDNLRGKIGELAGSLDGAKQQYSETKRVQDDLGTSTAVLDPQQQALADKFGLTADQVGSARTELELYLERLHAATDPVFGLLSALQQVDDAQRRYNEAVAAHGAGSAQAKGAAVQLAEAVARAEEAALNGELSYEDFRRKLDQWVAQGIVTAEQARAIRDRVDAARRAGERYGRNYNATITAQDRATGTIREVQRVIDSLTGKTIRIRAETQYGFTHTAIGYRPASGAAALAEGGPVRGPGGPRDDLVPLWGSDGEFMQPAAAVDHYGLGFMEAVRTRKLPRLGEGPLWGPYAPKLATGGPVDVKVRIPAGSTIENAVAATFARGGGLLDLLGASGGGGAGVERWRGVALQALAYTGSPLSWIGSLLRRMNQESGGNPRAINNWDINAQRGDPSRGLMQTIGATFYAYARELAGRGIYDPFANIVASIRYANARYGSAPIGWNRAGGYDTGGLLGPGQTGTNFTRRPERVLSPRQTESFEQLVRILGTKRGLAASLHRVGVGSGEAGSMGGAVVNLRVAGGKLEFSRNASGELQAWVRDISLQETTDELAFRGSR